MAAAASPMAGALATTAFANSEPDDTTEDDSADTPEADVKVTDTSSAGLNPSDPASIAEFTKKINDLTSRLDDSPEKTDKARFLAWAGGLNDPGGNGSLASGVINAAKSESVFDYKDKALRAQYTPLIINALTQQQQFAAQQKILNQPGGIPSLVGMPIDQAQRLNVALPGFKIMENWKLANPMGVTKGNSYRDRPAPNGGVISQYYPDPSKAVTMADGPNGPASVIPNAPSIDANLAGSKALATQQGKQLGGIGEYMKDDGTTFKQPNQSAIPGLSSLHNPFLSGLEQYAGQNNPPAAANGPLNHPEQQPPAQTPPQPQGAPQGQGAPSGAPGPGNSAIPPTLPPGAGGGPTPPAIRQTPNADPNIRGGFDMTNPRATIMAIAQIPDPQQRANAFKAFMQQVQGAKQPAFEGGGGPAQQLSGPAGPAPAPGVSVPLAPTLVSDSGIPAGAAKTGLSAAQTRVNTNMTEYNKKFMGETLPAVQQAGGQAADENIQAINTSQKALAELGDSGWGTEAKAKVANIAAAIGYPGAAQYASNAQEFQKAIQQQNLQTLRGQKGAQSDTDSKNVAQAYAALGSTKEANQYIFDVARAIQERNQLKARVYTQGVSSVNEHDGGDTSKIDQKWYANAPSILDMPSMQKYRAVYKKAGIPGY